MFSPVLADRCEHLHITSVGGDDVAKDDNFVKSGQPARRKRPASQKGVVDATPLPKESHVIETGEDIGVAAEDSVPAAENPVPIYEEAVPVPGGESVAPPALEVRAESGAPSVASIVEENATKSIIEPEAGIIEASVAEEFEVLEEFGNEALKVAEAAAGSFSENVQLFANEAKDYSKNSFESGAVFIGALLGAKSLGDVVQIQSSFAKSASARLLAHLMKLSGLYLKLVGEASKPFEAVTAKADRAKA
jgi:hypothetical protein